MRSHSLALTLITAMFAAETTTLESSPSTQTETTQRPNTQMVDQEEGRRIMLEARQDIGRQLRNL